MLLSEAVDAAVALFEGDDRPGDVVVDQVVAVVVQVDALRAGIGSEEQAHAGVFFAEIFDRFLLFGVRQAAVKTGDGLVAQLEIALEFFAQRF